MAALRLHKGSRSAWRTSIQMVCTAPRRLTNPLPVLFRLIRRPPLTLSADPPIKRFAERHKYMNIDCIATRDLGFVLNSRSAAARPSERSGLITRSDTVQSIVSGSAKTSSQSQSQSSSSKRASSPDHSRRRDESRDYPSKRARPGSLPRDRDRDKWDGPSHRRHGSPMWERDCDRSRRTKDEREDKGVQLPNVISEFIATLPAANTFDGACLIHAMRNVRVQC